MLHVADRDTGGGRLRKVKYVEMSMVVRHEPDQMRPWSRPPGTLPGTRRRVTNGGRPAKQANPRLPNKFFSERKIKRGSFMSAGTAVTRRQRASITDHLFFSFLFSLPNPLLFTITSFALLRSLSSSCLSLRLLQRPLPSTPRLVPTYDQRIFYNTTPCTMAEITHPTIKGNTSPLPVLQLIPCT